MNPSLFSDSCQIHRRHIWKEPYLLPVACCKNRERMTSQPSATAPDQHLAERVSTDESWRPNVEASQSFDDVPPTVKARSETKLTPFSGGEMEFYDDDVRLCGVSICSGPRSHTRRKILDALRKRSTDGCFVGYSTEQLAEKAHFSVVLMSLWRISSNAPGNLANGL